MLSSNNSWKKHWKSSVTGRRRLVWWKRIIRPWMRIISRPRRGWVRWSCSFRTTSSIRISLIGSWWPVLPIISVIILRSPPLITGSGIGWGRLLRRSCRRCKWLILMLCVNNHLGGRTLTHSRISFRAICRISVTLHSIPWPKIAISRILRMSVNSNPT